MRGDVAVITLDRPQKKNPLTFDAYAELRDTFRALADCADVKAVVLTGAGGNFCSGGDVLEIIGPLIERDMKGLLAFTRMTGDVVKAMRACPQPVDRGDRRRLRRRGRLPRHRLGPASRHAARRRPRSCSCASGSPAATWAPAPCCRGSIGQGRAAELLLHRPLDGRRGGPALGLLQPALRRASSCSTKRWSLPPGSPRARPSPI